MYEDDWLEAAYEDRNGGDVDTAVDDYYQEDTIEIEHAKYHRTKTLDGVTVETETVDAQFVERFLGAKSFFDGLVDRPEMHEQDDDGTITVTQTTPDGGTQVTTFEPMPTKAGS